LEYRVPWKSASQTAPPKTDPVISIGKIHRICPCPAQLVHLDGQQQQPGNHAAEKLPARQLGPHTNNTSQAYAYQEQPGRSPCGKSQSFVNAPADTKVRDG